MANTAGHNWVWVLAATFLVGCVPAGGSDDEFGGGEQIRSHSSEYPAIDTSRKYLKPGPVLASDDPDDLARRLDYHQKVIDLYGLSYQLRDNEAMHLSEEQLTGLIVPDDTGDMKPKSLPPPTPKTLPAHWDWREHGVGLPPARNQSSCGSCWAFGTIAAVEGAIAVFDQQIVNLSEQHVVDCNGKGYSCGGGYWAYQMIVNPGAAMEADYPYKARNQSCKGSQVSKPYSIEEYHGIHGGDIQAMKAAIYEYGVIGVTTTACGSIPGYGGGVYDSYECNNRSTNHIVAIVGWDDNVQHSKGKGIWYMRNSWGTSWGMDGYGNFAWGTANLEEDPTYVVYKPVDNTDTDGDGIPDYRDNCVNAQNPDQDDVDEDGKGNACDNVFDAFENKLSLSDDDSRKVSLHFNFPFYGTTYSEAYVNSDGNVTFGAGDSKSEDRSKARFLSQAPRIGALFADLNPAGGGSVSYGKADINSVFIKWTNVPRYQSSGGNSVTLTLDASGRITVQMGGVNGSSYIVGVSRGGTGNNASESDLSALGAEIPYLGSTATYEVFANNHPFDLTNKTFAFTTGNQPPPNQPDAGPDSGPDSGPTPPPTPSETTIALGDDDSKSIPLGFSFPFYGGNYDSVFVNSDGNLTFGAGDKETAARNAQRFLTGAPRIAMLYADLNPAAGGVVSYLHEAPDSITIRYKGVPVFGTTIGNSVSITLYASGKFAITFDNVSGAQYVVGVSRGGSGNNAPAFDLSSAGAQIGFAGANAVYEEFASGKPFDLSGKTITFITITPPSPGGDPVPAGPETTISLADDDFKSIPLGFSFPFYGQSYNNVFVNADGNLTFGAGDKATDERNSDRFLHQMPRIGVLYADLNPGKGGTVSYRKDTPVSMTITYGGIPVFGGSQGNNASVTLDASGEVAISIGSVSGSSFVVGVSKGGAANASPLDLSAISGEPIPFGGSSAIFESFNNAPFDLSGRNVVFVP